MLIYLSDALGYLVPGIICWSIFSVLLEIRLYIGKMRVTWVHRIALLLLGIYLTIIFSVTVSPMYGFSWDIKWQDVNLIPLQVLGDFKENPLNLLGNVAMFMPIGFFTVFISKEFKKIGKCVIRGVVLSFIIEIFQLFLGRGTDIDDIILNTLGMSLGYGIGILVLSFRPEIRARVGRFHRRSNRPCRGGTATVTLLGILMLVSVLGTGLKKRNSYMSHAPYKNTIEESAQEVSANQTKATLGASEVDLEAAYAYLIDVDTNEVLYAKDSDTQISPASTTKMLTALTVLEYCNVDEEVIVGSEINLIEEDASRAYLCQGNRLTIKQLLEGLLLPSGNDAAYTLAVFTGRKIAGDSGLSQESAISSFVGRMNEKAIDLGAKDSNFIKPDGYDGEDQYSTASDLACIAKEFMKSSILSEIVSKDSIREIFLDGTDITYKNTNELIQPDSAYYYENAVGLKTGSSGSAGKCLISAATINGELYLGVVMGSTEEGRWNDSIQLYRSIE